MEEEKKATKAELADQALSIVSKWIHEAMAGRYGPGLNSCESDLTCKGALKYIATDLAAYHKEEEKPEEKAQEEPAKDDK